MPNDPTQSDVQAVEPEAWLTEKLQPTGRRKLDRRVTDAAIYDVSSPDHWFSPEAMAEHRITPLVRADALAAANVEIARLTERLHDEMNFYAKTAGERYVALAQAGALELDMRERAAVRCFEDQGRFDTPDRIRALEPNPDAAAALQRALEAERKRCLTILWREFHTGSCHTIAAAILARGDKEGR